MADVTASTVTTLRSSSEPDKGSAHFSAVKINHEKGTATLFGFQLDQYELDSYTMWVNEVMERHAPED